MRKELKIALGMAVVVVGLGIFALLNFFTDKSSREIAPSLFNACGAPGQKCCNWAASPDFLNPHYCNTGAGCDIITNQCTAPCGGPGQVCCDGPDTFAPQGNSSPASDLYCINNNCTPRKEMCATGSCKRETRRCDELCGKNLGGACCPPDASVAVASCKTDNMMCEFDAHGMESGICKLCGEQGQPPCPGDECRASGNIRIIVRNGLCTACGYIGGPKCTSGRQCTSGAPDPNGPNCIAGGGPYQPCLEGGLCGYDGLFCNKSNSCEPCGGIHNKCCPPQATVDGSILKQCGNYTNIQCARIGNNDVCQYKPGQGPGSGNPPSPEKPPEKPPQTCGGNNYSFNTAYIPIWIEVANGCATLGGVYAANSFDEAVQCARAQGKTPVTEPVQEYEFSLVGGTLGCRTVQVMSRNESEAKKCAQAICINCTEPLPGNSCP